MIIYFFDSFIDFFQRYIVFNIPIFLSQVSSFQKHLLLSNPFLLNSRYNSGNLKINKTLYFSNREYLAQNPTLISHPESKIRIISTFYPRRQDYIANKTYFLFCVQIRKKVNPCPLYTKYPYPYKTVHVFFS